MLNTNSVLAELIDDKNFRYVLYFSFMFYGEFISIRFNKKGKKGLFRLQLNRKHTPNISWSEFKENKIVWLVFAYLPNIAILDLC